MERQSIVLDLPLVTDSEIEQDATESNKCPLDIQAYNKLKKNKIFILESNEIKMKMKNQILILKSETGNWNSFVTW